MDVGGRSQFDGCGRAIAVWWMWRGAIAVSGCGEGDRNLVDVRRRSLLMDVGGRSQFGKCGEGRSLFGGCREGDRYLVNVVGDRYLVEVRRAIAISVDEGRAIAVLSEQEAIAVW